MKLHSAWLLAVLLGTSAAQSAPSPSAAPESAAPARAAITGVVIRDPGGEPLKKTLIELITENQAEGGNYTAMTGADGAFHIEGILPGRYHLYAERTGFLEADKRHLHAGGRVLTLTAGQELKDLLIRLQPAAVIEGRVTDEDGDPLANAQVTVLQQIFAPGRRHWEQVGGEQTNDLGDYRIAGLAAGTYYISVTPPPNFKSVIETAGNIAAAESRLADDAAGKLPVVSYITTYYPGTKDRGQAMAVELHPGDDFPASFSLTPSPSVAVRGSIANLPAGAQAVVLLQSRDFSPVLNGADIHKDGSFEIRDVSPGAYTLVASVSGIGSPMLARQELQIGSENVEGVRLIPQSGAFVHGRLRAEGQGGAKADMNQFFLSLRRADGDDDDLGGALSLGEGFANVAHVSADGSFEWKNVRAGRYYVQVAGDAGAMTDWFLKSLPGTTRDEVDTGFSVNGGSVTLDLVASGRAAAIEGVVANHDGIPMVSAQVVAVPEPRFRQRADYYRKAVTDQSGHFLLRGVRPGSYTVLAWESVDNDDDYYDPEFLKIYEGQGRVLHLSEGERKNIQLEGIPLAGDQP